MLRWIFLHKSWDDLAHVYRKLAYVYWLCSIDLLVVVLGCSQMKCNGVCGVSNGQFLGGRPAASWNKGRGKRQGLWCSFRIVEMCVSVQLLAVYRISWKGDGKDVISDQKCHCVPVAAVVHRWLLFSSVFLLLCMQGRNQNFLLNRGKPPYLVYHTKWTKNLKEKKTKNRLMTMPFLTSTQQYQSIEG